MSGNNARLGFEQSIREGERESEQEKKLQAHDACTFIFCLNSIILNINT